MNSSTIDRPPMTTLQAADPLGISPFQREVLDVYAPTQMFAVVSWGCAATSWLAAVLNSHPDIFCVHAGNWFWRTLGNAPELDAAVYLRLIGSQGHAHAAAGDVHGVSRLAIPQLRATFGAQFNAAVVVRDPLRRVHSQLALFRRFERFETWDVTYVDAIIEQNNIVLPDRQAYADRFFVHAANMLNAVVEELVVGRVFRSEDLVSNADVLGDLIAEVTKGEVVASKPWLESAMQRRMVNVHAQASHKNGELADWQIDVIRRVVSSEAWDVYAQLGYPRPTFM